MFSCSLDKPGTALITTITVTSPIKSLGGGHFQFLQCLFCFWPLLLFLHNQTFASDSQSQSSDAQSLAATVQGTLRANSSHTEGTNQPTPFKFPQIPSNSHKFPPISHKFPQIPIQNHFSSLNPPSSVSGPALLRPKWPKA